MKKTISMLLAVLMAAIAVCTFGVSAFADETTAAANDDPTDAFVTEAPTAAPTEAPTEAATAAPTEAATEAPTEATATTAASSEETTNILGGILGGVGITTPEELESLLASVPVVTRDPSQTYIDDGDETTKAAAPATTKKPAKVESNIPSTGSTVVPVIALLALAAGTVAVVKTKKED